MLIFTLGVGNAWADYTVLFDANTSSEQTTLDGIVSTGKSYVTSVSASKTYMEGSGLRYGSSSAMGYTTFTMAASGQVQATKITFKQAKYYGSDNSSLKYTITYTDNTTTSGTVTLSNSAADKEVSLESTKTISTIDIRKTANSNKRFYCQGFTVTASAPAVSASITLNNYEGDATTSGYFVGDSFTLPDENDYSCGTKVFVGWSTVAPVSSATKPAANYYEPGESVTLAASNTFHAVFADESDGGSTNGSKTLVSSSSSTYYASGYITGSGNTTTATWTADAFTMMQNKNSGNNVALTYAEIRAYQYHTLVFTPASGTTITSITVNANSNSYANAVGGGGIENCTKSVSGSTVTITPTDGTAAITITQGAQSRINSIVVNYTTGGGKTYSNYSTSCVSTYTVVNANMAKTEDKKLFDRILCCIHAPCKNGLFAAMHWLIISKLHYGKNIDLQKSLKKCHFFCLYLVNYISISKIALPLTH